MLIGKFQNNNIDGRIVWSFSLQDTNGGGSAIFNGFASPISIVQFAAAKAYLDFTSADDMKTFEEHIHKSNDADAKGLWVRFTENNQFRLLGQRK